MWNLGPLDQLQGQLLVIEGDGEDGSWRRPDAGSVMVIFFVFFSFLSLDEEHAILAFGKSTAAAALCSRAKRLDRSTSRALTHHVPIIK